MAYFIFNSDNNIVKIAADDIERDNNNINITASNYTLVSVTDEQFNKVKLNRGIPTLNSDQVVITDIIDNKESENRLQEYLQDVSKTLKRFLKNNPSHPKFDAFEQYQELVYGFDTSSLTYPLDKSWESYCNDNSITQTNITINDSTYNFVKSRSEGATLRIENFTPPRIMISYGKCLLNSAK